MRTRCHCFPQEITSKVHISEHGANYQQTVSFNPRTQIGRVHNPQHLNLDESITLLHKPSVSVLVTLFIETFLPPIRHIQKALEVWQTMTKKMVGRRNPKLLVDHIISLQGMQLMLNNNHKHCEYSPIPDGVDPEMFAKGSNELESNHTTLTINMSEEVQMASIETGSLTEQERDALHPEMKRLCAGLDIIHVKTVPVGDINHSNEYSNETFVEVPHEGGRSKRFAEGFTCAGGLAVGRIVHFLCVTVFYSG